MSCSLSPAATWTSSGPHRLLLALLDRRNLNILLQIRYRCIILRIALHALITNKTRLIFTRIEGTIDSRLLQQSEKARVQFLLIVTEFEHFLVTGNAAVTQLECLNNTSRFTIRARLQILGKEGTCICEHTNCTIIWRQLGVTADTNGAAFDLLQSHIIPIRLHNVHSTDKL